MTYRIAARTLAGVITLTLAAAAAAQGPTSGGSPAKRELALRILHLQQADLEAVARSLVERPAAQMLQEAGLAIQRQFPPDKREAIGKQVEAEVKKYVDEAYPLVRDHALKIAPTTIGTALETKMTEDELRALLAWVESPVNKKFQQVAAESRNTFVQQVLRDAGPLVDPKLQALDGRVRAVLGLPPTSANQSAGTGQPPAKPASK